MNWLLFLHQIPPQPAYLRAKILRRLNQLGALPIKNSAYLLPAGEATLEDLHWVRREIVEAGGVAWVFHAGAVAGLSDHELVEAFRELRRADYEELGELAKQGDLLKLKRRYEEVRKIDFFDAPGRREVEALMRTMEQPALRSGEEPQGRRWVTRRGVKVDRISSAWLIRRCIDPQAEIRTVDPASYVHAEGEIRFDMFEGEYTHEGDRCTFEVLLERHGLADPALAALAEVIHDMDLKDGKFQRTETAGVATLIDGLASRHPDDDARRLEEGAALFEALYAGLRTA